MLKRVMVGLIVMSAAASMSFDDAEAGCALIAGKRMCAAWIKGSAKCLASIDDTSFGVGSCEVGGTEFGGTVTTRHRPKCGPIGDSTDLRACLIDGVISCSNNAPSSASLGALLLKHPDDDHDFPRFNQVPRFKTRRISVGDGPFESGPIEAVCDDDDCRITAELDLDAEAGEDACLRVGLAGFDTFTPNTGFMKAQFCNDSDCVTLVEQCTNILNVCGLPYVCSTVVAVREYLSD
jgi:hypothetical protein